jgi:MFS family permease
VGSIYSASFITTIIFAGYITENFNRKVLVGSVCFLWGVITYWNAYCTTVMPFYIGRFIMGGLQALPTPASYSLIDNMFPAQLKIRAFFVFTVVQQLGDTLQFSSVSIITAVGWRNCTKIVGGFGIWVGILMLLFVKEP